MNQTQCSKCLGDGIIGSGENPHLKLGKQVTCDACGGTGKVDAQVTAAPAEEVKTEETAPDADTQSTDGEEKKSEDGQPSTGEQSATTDGQAPVQDQVEKTEETQSTSTE